MSILSTKKSSWIDRKFMTWAVLGVLLLAGLACNFPGRVAESDEPFAEIHRRVQTEAFLSLQLLEMEDGRASIIIEWPLGMEADAFTAALLEAMVVVVQEIPDVDTLYIELKEFEEPFVSITVAAEMVRSVEQGETDAIAFFNSLVIEDQRSDEALLRRALEAEGLSIYQVDIRDEQTSVVLYVDKPFANGADIVALWLAIFEQIEQHVSKSSQWTLQLILPDYSQTTVTTSSADYRSFLEGSLEPAAYLALVEVVHQP